MGIFRNQCSPRKRKRKGSRKTEVDRDRAANTVSRPRYPSTRKLKANGRETDKEGFRAGFGSIGLQKRDETRLELSGVRTFRKVERMRRKGDVGEGEEIKTW